MEILSEKLYQQSPKVPFSSIEVGQLFRWGNRLMLKLYAIDPIYGNAVMIATKGTDDMLNRFSATFINDALQVIPVESKLIVNSDKW